jgi:hypothetical protein
VSGIGCREYGKGEWVGKSENVVERTREREREREREGEKERVRESARTRGREGEKRKRAGVGATATRFASLGNEGVRGARESASEPDEG